MTIRYIQNDRDKYLFCLDCCAEDVTVEELTMKNGATALKALCNCNGGQFIPKRLRNSVYIVQYRDNRIKGKKDNKLRIDVELIKSLQNNKR
jgi:hypothetical protein